MELARKLKLELELELELEPEQEQELKLKLQLELGLELQLAVVVGLLLKSHFPCLEHLGHHRRIHLAPTDVSSWLQAVGSPSQHLHKKRGARHWKCFLLPSC